MQFIRELLEALGAQDQKPAPGSAPAGQQAAMKQRRPDGTMRKPAGQMTPQDYKAMFDQVNMDGKKTGQKEVPYSDVEYYANQIFNYHTNEGKRIPYQKAQQLAQQMLQQSTQNNVRTSVQANSHKPKGKPINETQFGKTKGAKVVTKSRLKQKIKDGEWEAVNDLTRGGYQEIRNTKNNTRFTVQVENDV